MSNHKLCVADKFFYPSCILSHSHSIPQLAVEFRMPEGTKTSFKLDHLKHEILPTKSTIAVLPTRIEIRLRKKEPGIKWTSIEAKDELAAEKAKAAQEAYIEELNGSSLVNSFGDSQSRRSSMYRKCMRESSRNPADERPALGIPLTTRNWPFWPWIPSL
jgi:hypothetical protein